MDPDAAREHMLEHDLAGRGIRDRAVLEAMAAVPRELFVPRRLRRWAYADRPLSIGRGQTISQPYVVARMLELLELRPDSRVLEVGAGSGYAAALLARLAGEVHAVERHGRLATRARRALARLGSPAVVHHADGREGWPSAAPYDAILLSAATGSLPPALLEQLAPGGRLVAPVGDAEAQELVRIVRDQDGFSKRAFGSVRFVPLLAGKAR